jgi:hypothetical protein
VSPEDAAPEFADVTGSAMDVSPEPIELEKSEEADCTPAGSTSHIT